MLRKSQKNRRASRRQRKTRNRTRRRHTKVGGTTHYSSKHHPHGSINKHHTKVGGTTHYSSKHHHPHRSVNKHHAKVGGATHHKSQYKFSPAPFQKVGYLPGANSPRENARMYTQAGAANQHSMNKMAGGGMSALQPASVGTATIPQFPTSGPPGGTVTANSSSVVTNTASIAGKTNAVGDCYATNSCTKG